MHIYSTKLKLHNLRKWKYILLKWNHIIVKWIILYENEFIVYKSEIIFYESENIFYEGGIIFYENEIIFYEAEIIFHEGAGKCQYGAYDTTFVQHRRLADTLLVQAMAIFMQEDPIWQIYKLHFVTIFLAKTQIQYFLGTN